MFFSPAPFRVVSFCCGICLDGYASTPKLRKLCSARLYSINRPFLLFNNDLCRTNFLVRYQWLNLHYLTLHFSRWLWSQQDLKTGWCRTLNYWPLTLLLFLYEEEASLVFPVLQPYLFFEGAPWSDSALRSFICFAPKQSTLLLLTKSCIEREQSFTCIRHRLLVALFSSGIDCYEWHAIFLCVRGNFVVLSPELQNRRV